ncbi:CBS domain-containing protein [Alkalibaculum sporogenes]|uniref:CBS domain-containing protein n=1 Tax=Alkalibaculum sporogenes TaxID=2655001 RepID=UPI001FE3C2F4|nr:CBS domain-containing protein [Alkalibaculum sporogenes]
MKNILFFLLPKRDVVFLNVNCSLKFALEVMEKNGYSAIPLISDKGKYVGTLTEGDLLWGFKNNPDINFDNCSRFDLKDLKLSRRIKSAKIGEPHETILHMAKYQNFIPVTDDNGVFIGIIRRQEILDYLLGDDLQYALHDSEYKV